MLLLGLDFETSGLDTTKCSVAECGLVLWDTDLRAPVKLAGFLVDPGPDAIWETSTPEMRALGLQSAVEVHGITPEFAAKYGMVDEAALRQLLSLYKFADAVVAHNGHQFDFLLLETWTKRYGLEVPDKLRIDTTCDIERPPKMSSRLTYMAADYGFLNPFPHRALFDVMSMLRILDQHDLEKIIAVAKSPTLVVQALVSFEDKDKAKARGFYPEYVNGKFKMWKKSLKECYLEREKSIAQTAGFEIKVLSKK